MSLGLGRSKAEELLAKVGQRFLESNLPTVHVTRYQ